MSDASSTPTSSPSTSKKARLVNYSLRPAKNIERKMMGETFGRLAVLGPLSSYRYVGFGSEFFNDFSLYHQLLGSRNMISIERDGQRIDRCRFNRPYNCIEIIQGPAREVLPTLSWKPRSIVWLDYTEKLNEHILADVSYLVSQVQSGSMLVWSVNAEPWGGDRDEDTGERVTPSEWPAKRIALLRKSVGSTRVRSELNGSQLAKWGLAKEFHSILIDEIRRAINDRNGAVPQDSMKVTFRQIFHFRYADGLKMLTVGGLLLNVTDAERLGPNAFNDLPFVRTGRDALEINPPVFTSREIRFLNRLLPHDDNATAEAKWLSKEELASFRTLYRYYPIFAESEL